MTSERNKTQQQNDEPADTDGTLYGYPIPPLPPAPPPPAPPKAPEHICTWNMVKYRKFLWMISSARRTIPNFGTRTIFPKQVRPGLLISGFPPAAARYA